MSTTKRRKKERLAQDAKIAIVGGGLGGLGASLSLKQQGFQNVIVYERDMSPEAADEGYGLTLTYNPKGPLAKMNILEEVAQHDCPSRSHYVFLPDGKCLGYYGNAFMEHRGKGQRGNLRVPRKVLRRILLENNSCEVKWGKRLVDFDCKDETVSLQFDDGTRVDNVGLLVGADGIRSPIVKRLLSHKQDPTYGLRYMGVMIILGIANILHPLLDERGFYTLDGTHRLFTMPYEGSRLDEDLSSFDDNACNATGRPRRRIMWQLSYRLQDEAEAQRLSEAGPQALLDEVLRRCQTWHNPVLKLFWATPLDTIWGTGLMDRDPEELLQNIDPRLISRVVVLGDAAHSMSPFKGQGANQALLDGPLLASWLGRASVASAVRGFMREMVIRTAPKVKASRQAATYLHSKQVLKESQDFAGVRPDSISMFRDVLREKEIGAEKGKQLDSSIRGLIQELGVGVDSCKDSTQHCFTDANRIQELALSFSESGNTFGLRDISLKHASLIRSAKDKHGRNCLQLAARGGHYQCCRWLLSEALVSHSAMDLKKNTARDAAIAGGNASVIALLDSLQSHGVTSLMKTKVNAMGDKG